jgi:hypothetical protein
VQLVATAAEARQKQHAQALMHVFLNCGFQVLDRTYRRLETVYQSSGLAHCSPNRKQGCAVELLPVSLSSPQAEELL